MNVAVWPRDHGTRAQSAPRGGDGAYHFGDFGEIVKVSTSTRLEEGFGGYDLASWTVRMFPGYVGGEFLPRDHVEISHGGAWLFEGEYSEQELVERDPKGDTYTFHARGYAHVLYDYEAIGSENPDGAPDYAFPTTRLGWSDDDSTWAWERARQAGMQVYADELDLPSGPLGASDVAPEPIKLADVLTAHLLEAGEWWACWGPALQRFTLPTTPALLYDQPNTMVAVADTDYYSHVGVYYAHTAPGTAADQCDIEWAGADARTLNIFDRREVLVDLRGLGIMTSAAALSKATGMYEQVKGRLLLTGSLTLQPGSGLKASSGGELDVTVPRAGQMMQLSEVRDSLGFLMPGGTTSFVIGRTQYEWEKSGSQQVTITPMGAVSRNLGEILRGSPPDSTATVAGAA